jgi:protein-tyrosine phosphatase
MGVRTVIDLQERDQSAYIPPGVLYVPLRISEWRADRLDTAAVLRAIAESPKPVFIHCHRGRDRTGLAIAAFRLAQGATVAQVIEEARRFRLGFWWRGPIESKIRQLARQAQASPPTQPRRATATVQ